MTTRQTNMAIGIAALAAVAWLFFRKRAPIATVTTSETIDLGPYGGPTNYPLSIQNFGQAIARAEGFYVPGSIPARANNPGDVKATWLNLPTIGGGVTVFDSADQGWAALYRQLYLIVTGQSDRYNLDMTIADMGTVWTATRSEQSAWAANVATALGVPVDTPLYQVLV